MIGRVVTVEVEDEREGLSSTAAEPGRAGGKKRPENMTPERAGALAMGLADYLEERQRRRPNSN